MNTQTQITLTANETKALEALRASAEGSEEEFEGKEWRSVYLDNASYYCGIYGKAWSGILSSLSQKGLYREYDDAFGLVAVD